MQMSLGVSVLLRETKVDNVDLVAPLANTHQEVVGLDVTVNEVSRVDVFDSRDELIGEEKNSLQAEFAVAIEQVFQRWSPIKLARLTQYPYRNHSQQVENHCVVIAFRSVPSYEGDTDTAGQ
jgi:hypothetical protein